MNQYLKKRCALFLAAVVTVMPMGSPVLAYSRIQTESTINDSHTIHGNAYEEEVKTYGAFEYTSRANSKEVTITGYTGDEVNVVIPNSIDGKDVKTIGRYAFQNCVNIETVTLPQNLQSINYNAFSGCSKLTKVEFPNSLEYIDSFAFAYCSSLKSVHLPENVSFYGNIFPYCSSLESVAIDSAQYKVNDGLVYGVYGTNPLLFCCAGKKGKVVLPDGTVRIEEDAFAGCDKITGISIPSSVERFDKNATGGCSALQEFTVDSGNSNYTAIDGILYAKGSFALVSNTEIVMVCCPEAKAGKVKLPKNVKRLMGGFQNCSKLTEITLSENIGIYDISGIQYNSVHEPVGGTFSGCTSLTSIKVDEKNTQLKSIKGSVYSKDGKKLYIVPAGTKGVYTIPAGVTAIGGEYEKAADLRTFDSCTQITKIVIPESVKIIGKCAFLGCSKLETFSVDSKSKNFCSKSGALYDLKQTRLISCPSYAKTISIPDSVTTIAYNAFYECTRLPKVKLPAAVKKLEKSSVVECDFDLYFNSSQIPDFTIAKNPYEIGADGKEKRISWIFGCDKKFPTGYYFESLTAWKDAIAKDSNFAGITWKKAAGSPMISSSIRLDKATLSLKVKATATLKATVSGNASDKTVTWSTSDKSVATVSSKGVVTAKGVGTATITAKNNGKTAKCTVTVNLAQPKLKKAASSEKGKIKVTWSKVSGATGYIVYKKSGKEWKKLATVKSPTVSYTDKGLTSGKKYTYTVVAYKKKDGKTTTSMYDKIGVSAKAK